VIEEHYGDQVTELNAAGEDALAAKMAKFQEEEVAHKDLAAAEGAAEARALPCSPPSSARDVGSRSGSARRS